MIQKFSVGELREFTKDHWSWAYENYKLDLEEGFEEKKNIFDALKPWLDREQWDYSRKLEEEKSRGKVETEKEAKQVFSQHAKDLGIVLPEGVEIEVKSEEDENSSEVIE